jgi:hypothetical protein
MKLNPALLEFLSLLQTCWLTYLHIEYHKRLIRWWRKRRKQRHGPRQLRARDPSACPRYVHEIDWLERAGTHDERLHTRALFRAVVAVHIQLDELVTRVKQDEERVWIWTAIDAASKLILPVHLGRRPTADARELIHWVWQRLQPDTLGLHT